jgi:hypothetical protein
MENIHCKGAAVAFKLDGLPESNVQNIQLTDASLQARQGILINEGSDLLFRRTEIRQQTGAFIHIVNGKNIAFESVSALNTENQQIKIAGSKTQNITFKEMPWLRESLLQLDGKFEKVEVKLK